MHRTFLNFAYGNILASGVLHFLADVVWHHYRAQGASKPEPAMYYGLHTSYALGQLVFGLTCVLVLRSGSNLMSRPVGHILTFGALGCWLAVSFLFMPYLPPRANNILSLVLLAAAAITK